MLSYSGLMGFFLVVLVFIKMSCFLFLLLADYVLCLLSLQRLVVKPDQLIKRRGKLGLVGINLDLAGVQEWLRTHLMKETTVS